LDFSLLLLFFLIVNLILVLENEIGGKKERTIVEKDEIEIDFEWYCPRHHLLLKDQSERLKEVARKE
jgi:hypothetical protein